MLSNLEKLRSLLQELFQLDQADLDFGIYRIMNQKRTEIVRFLDKDLLPQVQEAFGHYKSADRTLLEKELKEKTTQYQADGIDPDNVPKIKELRQRLSESAVDVTALENEVFSYLYVFFRRYYHEGDFISLRRYKEGVYAIPYEGEEVKLHWANADQYYVKSSEYLRDYAFKLSSTKKVHFKLVETSSEENSNKPAAGQERRFILLEDSPVVEEGGELFIRFEHRADPDGRKQADLNSQAARRILDVLENRKLRTENAFDWYFALAKPSPTDANPNRTVLEKHLTQYTARNTFDYFIHKDLGGFLRRELDFYIKNEVMHLDDVENERSVTRVESYLSKIKVLRDIAKKIITFMEQLENFQKKLWLKKKFVVETNYCITLDLLSEELYPEIAANDAQREEWVRLFSIDEMKGDLITPSYSKPLSVEFLKANRDLVLDTRFFSQEFIDQVLRSIDDIDALTTGIVIHGDNFQALRLIEARFINAIDCVFIDPPYNTGNDEFIYKDSYRHSTWLSFLQACLSTCRKLLTDTGGFWCSLDSSETPRFWIAAEQTFGAECFAGHVIWQHSVQTKGYAGSLAVGHNNVLCFGKSPGFRLGTLERTEEHNASYSNPDNDPKGPWRTGYLVNSLYRPNLKYDVKTPSGKLIPPPDNGWRYSKDTMAMKIVSGEIFFSGDETRLIRKIYLENQEGHVPNSVWLGKESGTSRSANLALKQMLPNCSFATAKPVELLERIIRLTTTDGSVVLDYFAGSGTTAHAVLDLNTKGGGDRSFVLVEMGEHFDSLLLPRVKKALFAKDWKDGNPVNRRSEPHIVKYIRLESYEDALTNLELKRTSQQATLLDANEELREQYLLSYMLDVESRGSPSLLDIDVFHGPDRYKLRVRRNGDSQLVNVDLVETFNWLLGLTVKHIDVILRVRVVDGINPQGERVLVLWRNLDEMDNDALDQWFEKQGYSTLDLEYGQIYVNGDNNLENLRRSDQTWKVRLIEEEFAKLMLAGVED